MQSVLTSLIAVMGTLLGSSLTYIFQSRASRRAERFARDERLRQERMTVYSTYAGAVFDLRRKNADQWAARAEGTSDSLAYKEARAAKTTSRVAAYEGLAKVMLVTDDEQVIGLARTALELTRGLYKVESAEELDLRQKGIRQAVQTFVEAAAVHVK
ncbi:hypothetical protein [Nonomuraea sp. B19D2]|uniref:hypothetical protein n=1 Tax=Nonomuraea sp. B19D2 TaxID=3159561 RepID=UPI0032DAA9E3